MVIGRLKLFYHNMNQETCADCGYMRSTLSPCKCGKYASILPKPLRSSEGLGQIKMTKNEAELVSDLLKLYDEIWANGRCRYGCECSTCQQSDKVGEHENEVFKTLSAKVGKYA
jgi:hypothetical protein